MHDELHSSMNSVPEEVAVSSMNFVPVSKLQMNLVQKAILGGKILFLINLILDCCEFVLKPEIISFRHGFPSTSVCAL